jgi:spermidine synthase
MRHATLKVACLLFGSGFCALIYQTTWFREFRLIFGASTAASAAVLAIFMGGLGLGSWLLGGRADRSPRPLAFYANLELAIAASAALTPAILWVARAVYVGVGGTTVLGTAGGAVARLALAALVLGVPTVLMGGTLPAAARAAESDEDASRRNLAVLYGLNTLGAVTGAALSTFVMLETLGNRRTLWLAAAINVAVAIVARSVAGTAAPIPTADPASAVGPESESDAERGAATARPAPAAFVLAAAGVVGFAFFLMEIVWYRMLGPILGGSSFTFGLILAVALAGIGAGGAAYAMLGGRRPSTLVAFGLTCALEALFVAIPFALGDKIAILAALLRPLGNVGFSGHVFAWTIVTSIVLLPAAFVSGVQFPVLISLLGRGRENVGSHVGRAYAANTVGAIVGSLAGGFGILPLLTAPGTWRLVAAILALLGAVAVAIDARANARFARHAPTAAALVVALALLTFSGPTAAWRHSPIGAGRVHLADSSRNDIRSWANERRRDIGWEAEGRESSVALTFNSGYAFMVNGKVDGNARGDAGTQIMGGLLGGLLHPDPKSALVIGLGTGSSAGWLGAIPGIERVDAVELEPAILHVADVCSPVNHDVLHNPKVHVTLDDAREVLITTPRRYDVVFSEPSNPYRAGIASLYTQEFYRSAAARLNDGGLFCQWLQTYEVDTQTVRTVLATLASVFPSVEIWQTEVGDLILVGSQRPVALDAAALRERIGQEPFRSALAYSWRVDDFEGLLAHFVARDGFARAVLDAEAGRLNTDDRNFVEFGFARTVGRSGFNRVEELMSLVASRGEDRPTVAGDVDWDLFELRRVGVFVVENREAAVPDSFRDERRVRAENLNTFVGNDYEPILKSLREKPYEPGDLLELEMFAVAYASAGDAKAEPYIERFRAVDPTEADAMLAELRSREGRPAEAVDALVRAFAAYHDNPWPTMWLMRSATQTASLLAQQDKSGEIARRLYDALATPFAMYLANDARRTARYEIGKALDRARFSDFTRDAIREFEPNVPWTSEFLTTRANCYATLGDPLAVRARREADEFRRDEPSTYGDGIAPNTGP